MTPLRHVFHSFKTPSLKRDVTVGNEAHLPVRGENTVILLGLKGNIMKLQQVMYVPYLMCSLLSVRSMTKNGHTVHFENDEVKILEKNTKQMAATPSLHDDMYQIHARPMENHYNDTFKPDKCKEIGLYVSEGGNINLHGTMEVWHQRLSHAGKDAIRSMVKGN